MGTYHVDILSLGKLRRWGYTCFALTLATMAIFVTASAALAQQDFSKVEIKVSKVAGGVYMLEGSGGNIGVSVC